MGELSGGWVAAIAVVQIVVFVLLVLLMIRLVKVIKSQNNGVLLPPDVSARLKKLFGGKGKK